MTDLYTPWGEALDKTCPLPEYPRPQMVRDSYLCLNGLWAYAILPAQELSDMSDSFVPQGQIVVPYVPESLLSGVKRQVKSHEVLCYRRNFVCPEGFVRDRVLLHFGAVDQIAHVRVNGQTVAVHEGGYLPFSADITEALRAGDNQLTVFVTDDVTDPRFGRGKQAKKRGGIWYTATCGIWQTVWLESVPNAYITGLKITPDIDKNAVTVAVTTHTGLPAEARVEIIDRGQTIAAGTTQNGSLTLSFPSSAHLWTPDDPYLYDLSVTLGEDTVTSYFGMRRFARETVDGVPRLTLNHRPLFAMGLLDQGFYSDGIPTPPSDAAMAEDIRVAKRCGYNMLRKHIKIEPLRWYYHCDRLGMLVWQDMVNSGDRYRPLYIQILPFLGLHLSDSPRHYARFGRRNADGREKFLSDMKETVDLLYNTVSLSLWVPFNEGWGQFDAAKTAEALRVLDPTRPIDHASGWHDQGAGDVKSRHVYYKKIRLSPDRHGRALALTEFGGYSLPVPGHMFSPDKMFGYRIFRSQADFVRMYCRLLEREVIPLLKKGLCAAVYTQLTDVEDEINGILTYDRRVLKFTEQDIAQINALHRRLTDVAPPVSNRP